MGRRVKLGRLTERAQLLEEYMKPLLGLILTLSVVLLCECMPAGADEPLKPGQSFKDCATDCPEMVVIPAGSFTMGSPQYEPGHKKD
jgi:formylglycine-generating enzyme required for sulfatase activity